jgi:hypothetical protein
MAGLAGPAVSAERFSCEQAAVLFAQVITASLRLQTRECGCKHQDRNRGFHRVLTSMAVDPSELLKSPYLLGMRRAVPENR